MARTKPQVPRQPDRPQGRKAPGGVLLHLLILLILGAVGWELWTMQQQVRTARAQQEALQAQAQQLQEANDALEKDLQEGATQDKLEELARSDLGLAKSNEYIFYDRQN